MRHFILHILLLAVLLVVPATFTSCSSDEQTTPAVPTYTLSVEATKDVSATRALTLEGKTLTASWKTGESVTVYNASSDYLGTLTAQSDGASTILSGTLTGTISNDDVLTLKFCSDDYSTQTGTLEDIATHCDYATATVTVTVISGERVTTTDANFINQQAIVKFTLKDKADNGATTLNASSLSVTANGSTYTVTPTSATSVLYVAIPGIDAKNITLSAAVGSDTYTYDKANVTFSNGQYYAISVKMTRQAKTDDIGKVMAQNGCIYDDIAAVHSSTSAVGMIAYVGSASDCTNGLAIALADEAGDKSFGNAGSAASAHTAVPGGTWRVPSQADWNNMRAFLTEHHQGLKNGDYWTSTASTGDNAFCATVSNDGNSIEATQQRDKIEELNVRVVLAF